MPKFLKFVRIIHYYSKLFTGVLRRAPGGPLLDERRAEGLLPVVLEIEIAGIAPAAKDVALQYNAVALRRRLYK